jgi:hypothetical protein
VESTTKTQRAIEIVLEQKFAIFGPQEPEPQAEMLKHELMVIKYKHISFCKQNQMENA